MLAVTIIIFIIILGLLVFVHELGHFLAARRAGCRILEFGFGFPPRLWGIKKGDTTYSINAIPIGGFVRIFGEDGGHKKDQRSFAAKTKWQRFQIIVAGVVMNLLLAVFVLFIGFMVGLPGAVDDETTAAASSIRDVKIRVAMVMPESPAAEAEFKIGDALLTVNGEEVTSVSQAQDLIKASSDQDTEFMIARGDEELTITAVPISERSDQDGRLGIVLGESGIVSYPWYRAAVQAVVMTGVTIVQMFWVVGELVKNLFGFGDQVIMQSVSGPVGIAMLTDTFRKLGFNYLLWFTAFLSINLGIINILPFPALDGGRLVFLGIEAVRGKKAPPRWENLAHTIGFALLILVMILITFRDVIRISEPLRNLWERVF